MTRKKWDKVAHDQFESLSEDIQQDWGDLYELTSARSVEEVR